MAHRRLCKASAIFSILVLLFVSVSVVSCDIQFTEGTAIQEVFEDQLVNDDVSLHSTESSIVTIRLVPDTSVPETIETYIVKFYRNDEEVKSVEVPPIGPLSFVLTDLPRASYIIEAKALTHEGLGVAVGKASIQVTSSGAETAIELETPVHVHELVHVAAQDASCTENGLKEHWYCSLCGKRFANEKAENETTYEELVIQAKGHSYPETPNETHEHTCVEDGYEVRICTVCGDKQVKKTSNALGHEDSEYFYNEEEHWKVCSRCKEEYGRESHSFTDWIKGEDGIWRRHCEKCLKEETNNHIAHTMEHHPAISATCEKDGNKEYWKCSVCGKCFSDAEGIDIVDESSIVLPKMGHDFFDDWTTDGTHHWHDCSRCDAKDSYEEHDFGIVYDFDADARNLSISSFCTVCKEAESSGSQPSQTGAFDISTAFGIDVERKSSNSWRVAVEEGIKQLYSAYPCTWTSSDGKILLKGPEPFTMTVEARGDGRYIILCHLYDGNGNEKEICFVQISSNSK